MKYQALFYQKNNEKNSRLSSAAVVIGTLRVKQIAVIILFQCQTCHKTDWQNGKLSTLIRLLL